MFFISNNNITDPRINLALEEYCLRNLDVQHQYLLFYINEPSIIVGRNQNTFEEINHKYVQEKGIHVVRRISGGGSVYHDHGNLNFSFITKYDNNSILNFRKFTTPVIKALRRMGIPAKLTGRSDIVAEGRKISGNAQYSTRKSMLSHGTLLFDSETDIVDKVLNVKIDKIESEGLKSVRSRVANICEYLESPIDMDTFKNNLLKIIFEPYGGLQKYKLTEKGWANVYELSEEKYQTWEWNYGKSPKFNIQKIHRFDIGQIETRIDVEKGIIKCVKIYGDFHRYGNIGELEKKFAGKRYDVSEIRNVLNGIDLNHYFGQMPLDSFADYLY